MEDIIIHGDVYAALDQIEDGSVKVAITSPPYWKQRDYGFEGQIGQERTPEEYLGRLVKVYSKLREKLSEDGVFFLNVGDKYLNRYGKSHLLQIPYRLAFHMVRDGWRLEDVLIWYKPNHMPSSVRDRFANTYEPILVFTKGEKNAYIRKGGIVKIPVQQTPWKHTAVFPEKLVESMLERTALGDGDVVLDPFAGTGTVAAVVRRMRTGLFPRKVYSIMIEKSEEFVSIIRERAGIGKVVSVEDVPYEWAPVEEERLPDVPPLEILGDRHGEVFIARDSEEFLRALRGTTTPEFRSFHREDALYFFGVRDWTLEDLYYPHSLFYEGYVLRNMLVVSRGDSWYPVFMFARDTTRVAYKFYLDRIRIRPKTREARDWGREQFLGMKVRDISGKKTREGRIVKILDRYDDGFPKLVMVRWDGTVSVEFALHPERDEFVMEGLKFMCPVCGAELEEPYDPVGENLCPRCGSKLWESLDRVPKIKEPEEIREIVEFLEDKNTSLGEVFDVETPEGRKRGKSKFFQLDRINWGASPGARKAVLGEYFTKMRLYRVDQPAVAQYLNLLRRSRNLTIKEIVRRMPPGYTHTVGHWFRKDFGGSIPVPEDIPLLMKALGVEKDGFLEALTRTALKFQTVKASIKGRNPGDFIEGIDGEDLRTYLRKLYIPPSAYIKMLAGDRI
ncbi:DNA methyltransferase [Thermococcus sp.]|uniref:DNA methyltransferase n=1 Tax=Thermococcus sp. TaxID=35749 RepID=UPI002637F4F3|nr:DNA methyltransferase [Thermococcus sp.]